MDLIHVYQDSRSVFSIYLKLTFSFNICLTFGQLKFDKTRDDLCIAGVSL